jgi:hypothetical protein
MQFSVISVFITMVALVSAEAARPNPDIVVTPPTPRHNHRRAVDFTV